MKNHLPSSPPSSSSAPPPIGIEVPGQLRSALIAMRDALFDLQDSTTRVGDVVHDLHALVVKIEALMAPPDAAD